MDGLDDPIESADPLRDVVEGRSRGPDGSPRLDHAPPASAPVSLDRFSLLTSRASGHDVDRSDGASVSDRGDADASAYWNPDELRRWADPGSQAPSDAAPLGDDLLRLCAGLREHIGSRRRGLVEGRELRKLSRTRHGVDCVVERVCPGGIDQMKGTLIIASGRPPELHVFRKSADGPWLHHRPEEAVGDARPMRPSVFLQAMERRSPGVRIEAFRLCDPAELTREDEALDPLRRPGGLLERRFRLR